MPEQNETKYKKAPADEPVADIATLLAYSHRLDANVAAERSEANKAALAKVILADEVKARVPAEQDVNPQNISPDTQANTPANPTTPGSFPWATPAADEGTEGGTESKTE